MVPLGNLVTFRNVAGPDRVPRYNLFPTVEVNGATQPGVSSGQALSSWAISPGANCRRASPTSGPTCPTRRRRSAARGYYIFALSVVFVFLALAAQYESWSLPLAIMLIVPMCLLGALFGVTLHGQDINILTQIGFIVLIGLAAKNAILIVEFARQLEDQGRDTVTAAVEACQLRLRPILMTSLAFIARRRAAVHRDGRRRGDAHRARYRRVLGHDRRDAVRPDLHAGVLRRHPPAFDAQGAWRCSAGCGAGGIVTAAG